MKPHRRLISIKKELINKGFIVNDENFDYLLLIPNASYELEVNLQKLFKEYKVNTKFYSQEWFRYEGLIKNFVKLYHEYEIKYSNDVDLNLLMFDLLKNRLTSHAECVKRP